MDIVLLLKKFHYLATPVGFIAALTILAALFWVFRKKNIAKFFAVHSLLAFWLFSSPWFAQSLEAFSASLYPHAPAFDELNTDNADAIVVATWLKPMPADSDYVVRFPNEKVYNAAQLSKKLDIPIIVISSQFPPNPPPKKGEVTYAQAYLTKLKVKPKNILITRNQRNTNEALKAAAAAAKDIKAKNIILIASGARLARKYLTLKQIVKNDHINITPFNRYFGSPSFSQIRFNKIQQWIPSVHALNKTDRSLHDLLGLLAYRLLNWI